MKTTIDMAREAGWKDLRDYDSEMRHAFFMGNTDSLKAFEALVRADERADCERVVGIALLGAEMDLAKRVLRAIRVRGNP
jgi:hypothetical protein